MKFPVRCQYIREARCWWWMPARRRSANAPRTATNRDGNGFEVVPVLNKIDLPAASDPERVAEEIEDIVGIDATDAVRCPPKRVSA